MEITTIGLDLAKQVFQIHGVDEAGDLVVKRRLRSRNDQVRNFFRSVDAHRPAEREILLGAARRRLSEFLLPEAMQRIFSYHEEVLDLRAAMDEGAIILIDLSYETGRVSEDETTFLGTLLASDAFLSCLGRPEGSTPCFLIVDEAHRIVTRDLANVVEQARKFGLHLLALTQHPRQFRESDPLVAAALESAVRTKVVFTGLGSEDCAALAEDFFRGWIDLQESMHRFDHHEVVGYELDWLLAESDTRGTGSSTGTTWARGGSIGQQQSSTLSESETETEQVTIGRATTRSLVETDSASTTRSQSVTESESTTVAEMEVETEGRSHTDFANSHQAAGQSYDYAYDPMPIGQLPYGVHASEISGQGSGSADTVSSAVSRGSSVAQTRGRAITEGLAETEGHSTARGISEQESCSLSKSRGRTTGSARTVGASSTQDWSQGGNQSVSVSQAATRGRSQALRPVLGVLPGAAYPLDKLMARCAWQIANLPDGYCIVKIGRRPPAKIQTLYQRPAFARPEHVARVCQELSEQTPFLTRTAEVDEAHAAFRRQLAERVSAAVRRRKRGDPDEEA